jgi:hypothetical protein
MHNKLAPLIPLYIFILQTEYILDFEFVFFSRNIFGYFLSITSERDPIIPPCGRTDSNAIGMGTVEFL